MSWNNWRKNYKHINYDQQMKYYKKLEDIFPNQNRFNLKRTIDFFDMIEGIDINVFEFGGFKGDLAKQILPLFTKIKNWHNYEICPSCTEKSVCDDERYKCIIPSDYAWKIEIIGKYDVLYASHSAEHIKFEELKSLIENVDARYVYLDMPIQEDIEDMDWEGYGGTHIFEVGWKQIDEYMCLTHYKKNGFYIKADEVQ